MLKTATNIVNVNQITGVLPVVNGGTGVTTSTGTGSTVLSAAPTLSGNVTLSTGNLVLGTSGKGIDFSADPSAPGMTSELLDDYEEGVWTIADDSGAGLSLSVSDSSYTKIGRIVYVQFNVSYPVTASGAHAAITLPFVVNGYAQITGRFGAAVIGVWQCQSGVAQAILHTINGGSAVTNAQLSGQYVIVSGSYQV